MKPETPFAEVALARARRLGQIEISAQAIARYRAKGNQLRHVISNLVAEIDGDQARASCYLTVFLTRDGGQAWQPVAEFLPRVLSVRFVAAGQ